MISTFSCKVRFILLGIMKQLISGIAHGGLQGTTRPTHYYVVHDEIGFGADELQTLTNSVSYMFARATKAVSLVSPAYVLAFVRMWQLILATATTPTLLVREDAAIYTSSWLASLIVGVQWLPRPVLKKL
jgi:hypothetical protein